MELEFRNDTGQAGEEQSRAHGFALPGAEVESVRGQMKPECGDTGGLVGVRGSRPEPLSQRPGSGGFGLRVDSALTLNGP